MYKIPYEEKFRNLQNEMDELKQIYLEREKILSEYGVGISDEEVIDSWVEAEIISRLEEWTKKELDKFAKEVEKTWMKSLS